MEMLIKSCSLFKIVSNLAHLSPNECILYLRNLMKFKTDQIEFICCRPTLLKHNKNFVNLLQEAKMIYEDRTTTRKKKHNEVEEKEERKKRVCNCIKAFFVTAKFF